MTVIRLYKYNEWNTFIKFDVSNSLLKGYHISWNRGPINPLLQQNLWDGAKKVCLGISLIIFFCSWDIAERKPLRCDTHMGLDCWNWIRTLESWNILKANIWTTYSKSLYLASPMLTLLAKSYVLDTSEGGRNMWCIDVSCLQFGQYESLVLSYCNTPRDLD